MLEQRCPLANYALSLSRLLYPEPLLFYFEEPRWSCLSFGGNRQAPTKVVCSETATQRRNPQLQDLSGVVVALYQITRVRDRGLRLEVRIRYGIWVTRLVITGYLEPIH